MGEKAPKEVIGDSAMSLQGRGVVVEETAAWESLRGEAQVEAPPESILNKDGMKRGHETTSHRAP